MEEVRILIVEDDAALRTIMALILEELPHSVSFADSGAVALTAAAETFPDVVFIDLGLPDMSGFELARRFRERGSRARLVALTGFDDPATRAQANEAGFDRFFTSPWNSTSWRTYSLKASAISRRRQTPSRHSAHEAKTSGKGLIGAL
ncbi:hypothetical protein CAI21_20310 [Alkalilimnicola ehrlichii]|uniref:Response regulatory domain-containing protein n=1 Tax=Alkalilimnicola ehrlichii TaxID=351052 RepID=A0A3E0WJG5_9GAMM|nr:response regulator [Alkalilimnicola ehrlichii]RFA24754.1 hypothetical protein CAI21_20310 [Alkalilimnicola ehrlichii]RFA32015.1 hypothetical protein CAL65_20920 [Alkalilimnicola ehrlichii]